MEDLSGILFVGVDRWGEPGNRKLYGDHSCSPGESGDELGAGWPWASGMVASRGEVWGAAVEGSRPRRML